MALLQHVFNERDLNGGQLVATDFYLFPVAAIEMVKDWVK